MAIKLRLTVDNANWLIDWAKHYTNNNSPVKYAMLGEVKQDRLYCTMNNAYIAGFPVFPVTDFEGKEDEPFVFLPPTKKFKATDLYVELAVDGQRITWSTAFSSERCVTDVPIEDFKQISLKKLIRNEDKDTSIYADPKLMIQALTPYVKFKEPVKISILGWRDPINISMPGAIKIQSVVLPCRPPKEEEKK